MGCGFFFGEINPANPVAVSSTMFNVVQHHAPSAQCDTTLQVGHPRCTWWRWREVDELRLVNTSASACAGVLSSSSSDASAMADATGTSGAGTDSICFANKSPVECSSLAFATLSRKSSSLHAHNRRHRAVQALFSSQRCVIARDAHSSR